LRPDFHHLSTLKLKENCKAFDVDFALRIGRPVHLLQVEQVEAGEELRSSRICKGITQLTAQLS
jgi:hypothetical protein